MKVPMGIDQRVIVGAFALACMSVAGFAGYHWLSGEKEKLNKERAEVMKLYQSPVEVVVAAKDIAEETVLDASHIEIASIPEKFVQPYAVLAAEKDKVPGKVTVANIAKGEQLLKNKLRRLEDQPRGTSLSAMTPKGKRAVTIAVDAITGVNKFIKPRDIVDILWTIKLPDASQKEGQVVTLTLFQDVPVLAVDSDFQGVAARPAADKDKEQKDNQFLVTLALPPQETSFLLFAREQGRIQLSLRPRAETGSRADIVPANINTLMQVLYGAAGSDRQPRERPVRQVEIYRGIDKKETVSLPSE